MVRPFYFFLLALCFISACDHSTDNRKPAVDSDFTWHYEGAFSFTDINNYEMGYAAGDEEALGLEFGHFLLDALKRTGLTFYDEEDNEISAKEAEALLTQTYTVRKEVPEEEDEFYYESVEKQITAEDIIQVVSRESWYFNEETFQVQKKVTHLAPVIYVFDADGDVRGKKLLFWLKVN